MIYACPVYRQQNLLQIHKLSITSVIKLIRLFGLVSLLQLYSYHTTERNVWLNIIILYYYRLEIQYCNNDIIDLGFVSCHIHMHAGPTSVSMNVHQLRHLVYHVKNFGPLWVYSCFGFESRNGDLKRLFHGTKNMSNHWYLISYTYMAN